MTLTIQFKKAILEFLMVFTSFSIILIYLYLRITRKQRVILLNAEEIQLHYNMFLYFFFISCIMFVLLFLSLLLKQLKPKEEFAFFDKFLLNLKKKLNDLNIFYTSYVIIFKYFNPKYTHYLVTYANKILEYGTRKNIIIVFCAVVLPRILIVCIFCLELYIKMLHYYFFSLLLLLIPLFFRFLLFVYSDIHKHVLPELNEVVEKVPNTGTVTIKTPEGEKTFTTIGYRFKILEGDDPNANYDLDHFMTNYYNPMLFIEGHMTVRILPLYYKINNLTMWIYTGIQILGWSYVLFYVN